MSTVLARSQVRLAGSGEMRAHLQELERQGKLVRISRAIGCPGAEVPARWREAMAQPLPPVLVDAAPAQEVVHSGEELIQWGALDALPVPISTPGFDNAPYFNSGVWIVRDPETGLRNAGLYRGMIKSPTRTGIFSDSSKDTTVIWEKCNRD